ncbi:hypothetical protein [Marinobacterium nitratireducens]|uniref:hypothetical protein n=1 Tax=Marinobacterium nitratireducens TaxID=518897 RepID=UPI0016665FA2|nr:hypothetical protein [Marinobacterium nitratireducens]
MQPHGFHTNHHVASGLLSTAGHRSCVGFGIGQSDPDTVGLEFFPAGIENIEIVSQRRAGITGIQRKSSLQSTLNNQLVAIQYLVSHERAL